MMTKMRRWVRPRVGKRVRAFTLIEMVVVVVLVAVLAKITLPLFQGTQDDAIEDAMISDARSMVPLLQQHFSKFSTYPSTVTGTGTATANTIVFPVSPDNGIRLTGVSNSGYTARVRNVKLRTRECTVTVNRTTMGVSPVCVTIPEWSGSDPGA